MQNTYNRLDQIVVPRPNWGTTVKEVLEYRTELFMSEDGHEERHSYRTNPRWSVQYKADMAGAASRELFYDLVRPWADRSFAVPVRWRNMPIREFNASGSASMTFDGTAPWWLQVGMALVLESAADQDMVLVDGITQNPGEFTLDFAAGTEADFTVGDRAMMAIRSHYEQENALKSLIRSHRGFSPTFLADPARMPVLQPPTTGYEVYRGYEVVPGKHNWDSSLDLDLDDRRETVDFDRGVIDRVWERTHRIITETRTHTAMGADQTARLVQMFMRHRGMRVPFWTPLAGLDLPQPENRSSGSSILVFSGLGLWDIYEDDPVLNHLWVQWPDGAVQVNRIEGYTVSSGDEVAQMEDDWERDIDENTKVRWAVLARFGTDRLEINWQTATVAQAQLPIRALRTDWVPDNDTTDNLKWP